VFEALPVAMSLIIHGVFACPVLDRIFFGERFTPRNSNRIYRLLLTQIDDDPLRMQNVIVATELASKVRIAFPICVGIAIIEARESIQLGSSITSKAAMGQ